MALVTCYQLTPGGNWSGWKAWRPTPQNSQFIDFTAAQQNDGRVQLWAIDTKLQLWSWYQTLPGGNWTAWSVNWDGAPPLRCVFACQQGGTRGSQLWGIKPDFTLISNFQLTPGGKWNGWSSGSWLNAPPVYELSAAQQNNGCVILWAVGTDQVLRAISQTSPGGDWGSWS